MRLTAYQIAEAFPEECKEFIPKVLPVLRSKLLAYREQVKRIENMPVEQDTKNLYLLFVDCMSPIETKRRIEDYEQAIKIVEDKDKDKYLSRQHAVASSKARPIETLYGFQKMKIGTARVSACCPFHDESNPSFVIYRHTNTFHCFTCKVSGDSIEFFMKINKTDFSNAVKELSRWNT